MLAMMSQAGEDYNPAKCVSVSLLLHFITFFCLCCSYAKFKPRQGGGFGSNLVKQPPPSNYVCHRCGLKGHWIKFCPTNGVSLTHMYNNRVLYNGYLKVHV